MNDLRVIKLDQASILTDECGISERIKYLESVLTQENLENIPSFQRMNVNDNLNFLQCSLDFPERVETSQVSWAGRHSPIDSKKIKILSLQQFARSSICCSR